MHIDSTWLGSRRILRRSMQMSSSLTEGFSVALWLSELLTVTRWLVASSTLVLLLSSCAEVGQSDITALRIEHTHDQLVQMHNAPNRVTNATEALAFAVSFEEVFFHLTQAGREANYKSWACSVHKNNPDGGWEVAIKSLGMIPSFSCEISLSSANQLAEVTQHRCGYNK